MTIILLIYVALVFWGASFAGRKGFHTDYCALMPANAVKGCFVMLVFFRHFKQYVELGSAFDRLFLLIDGQMGQMIVVPFLFFSGYGLMYGIRHKGTAYVREIPRKRALRVWVHFAFALLFFLAARILIGKRTRVKQFLLSLVCVKSIGNSNWYIMAIVLCYLFTWVAFMIFRKDGKKAAALQTLLVLVSIAVMSRMLPDRYSNTILSFSAGIWYCLYQDKIEKLLAAKVPRYYVAVGITWTLLLLIGRLRDRSILLYDLGAVVFAFAMLLFTMKIRVNNKILQYMGSHVFSLYILQRLPMMVLAAVTDLAEKPYVFFVVSLVLTIPISWLFDEAVKRIDRLIF